MTLDQNTGDRPSKLQIGRLLTGELEGEDAAGVQAWVDAHPEGRAHVQAVEEARSAVAPFDAAALRGRAAEAPPIPANNNRAFLALVPVLLFAAIAMAFVLPTLQGRDDGTVDPSYIGTRGSAGLQVFHLEAAGLADYDQRQLGEGDVLGFRVVPGTHEGVVLLSIDGTGQVSIFYPESGSEPVALEGQAPVALPGSIVLDDAPGPETFIAVFDRPVEDARAEAERAWQAGGQEGLTGWAENAAYVDLEVVNRR